MPSVFASISLARLRFEAGVNGAVLFRGDGNKVESFFVAVDHWILPADNEITLRIAPSPDPASALVYAVRSSDVRDVLVDGRVLVRGGQLTDASGLDAGEVVARATEQARRVASKAATLRA